VKDATDRQTDRKYHNMKFEVFTAVRMMMFYFWVLVLCRLVGRCQMPEDGGSMFLRNVGIY
jgi:hypothetical protein